MTNLTFAGGLLYALIVFKSLALIEDTAYLAFSNSGITFSN